MGGIARGLDDDATEIEPFRQLPGAGQRLQSLAHTRLELGENVHSGSSQSVVPTRRDRASGCGQGRFGRADCDAGPDRGSSRRGTQPRPGSHRSRIARAARAVTAEPGRAVPPRCPWGGTTEAWRECLRSFVERVCCPPWMSDIRSGVLTMKTMMLAGAALAAVLVFRAVRRGRRLPGPRFPWRLRRTLRRLQPRLRLPRRLRGSPGLRLRPGLWLWSGYGYGRGLGYGRGWATASPAPGSAWVSASPPAPPRAATTAITATVDTARGLRLRRRIRRRLCLPAYGYGYPAAGLRRRLQPLRLLNRAALPARAAGPARHERGARLTRSPVPGFRRPARCPGARGPDP